MTMRMWHVSWQSYSELPSLSSQETIIDTAVYENFHFRHFSSADKNVPCEIENELNNHFCTHC